MDDSRLHVFKPYTFPQGRRLDGWFAGSQTGVRHVVVPSLDVAEGETAYRVTAVVPGADKEEISISIEDGVLRLAGEMPWTEEDGAHRLDRDVQCFRAFSREVRIDKAVDLSRAEVHFEDGVLTARLPYATSAEVPEVKHILLKVT